MLGYNRHASQTPYKWHFADGPMMAHIQWDMEPPSLYHLRKKNVVKVGPPSDKTFCIRACKRLKDSTNI